MCDWCVGRTSHKLAVANPATYPLPSIALPQVVVLKAKIILKYL